MNTQQQQLPQHVTGYVCTDDPDNVERSIIRETDSNEAWIKADNCDFVGLPCP